MRCGCGIEHDELDGQPVARRATPAPRVCTPHAFVQLLAPREDRAFAPVMTLIGRHVADRAVAVRAAVPVDEASHPAVGSMRARRMVVADTQACASACETVPLSTGCRRRTCGRLN